MKPKTKTIKNPLPKNWQVIKWDGCKTVFMVIDNRGHIYPQTRAKTPAKCLQLFEENFKSKG